MAGIMIKRIDHLVLTTQKPWECLAFYEALGFTRVETAGRYELRSRNFKIDVHVVGRELPPYAKNVQAGSMEFCFEVDMPLGTVLERLKEKEIVPETEPVVRSGFGGKMTSVFLRDPDGNLIELAHYSR